MQVLSELRRTRLSRHRMIWLLPHPLPSTPVSKLSVFLCLPVCRWSSFTGGGGGEPNRRRRESLVLYKSFSTLWSPLCNSPKKILTAGLMIAGGFDLSLASLRFFEGSARRNIVFCLFCVLAVNLTVSFCYQEGNHLGPPGNQYVLSRPFQRQGRHAPFFQSTSPLPWFSFRIQLNICSMQIRILLSFFLTFISQGIHWIRWCVEGDAVYSVHAAFYLCLFRNRPLPEMRSTNTTFTSLWYSRDVAYCSEALTVM